MPTGIRGRGARRGRTASGLLAVVVVVVVPVSCGRGGGGGARAATSMADEVAAMFGRSGDDVTRWLDDAALASGRSMDDLGDDLLRTRVTGLTPELAAAAEQSNVEEEVLVDAVCGALDEVLENGWSGDPLGAALESAISGRLPPGYVLRNDVVQLLAEPGDPEAVEVFDLLLAQIETCPLSG